MEIRPLLSALWRSRTGPLLVAAQIAIALTALVNVAYVVHQRWAFNAAPTGIDIESIFWMRMASITQNQDDAVVIKEDLNYLSSVPGVIAASTVDLPPQSFSGRVSAFSAEPPTDHAKFEGAHVMSGSSKVLESLGLKLKAGRTFNEEAVEPPAKDFGTQMGSFSSEVVITDALAKKLFPSGDALGKPLYWFGFNRPATIVGIVEHMQYYPASEPFRERANQVVIRAALARFKGSTYLVRVQPGRLREIMTRVERHFDRARPGDFINRIDTLAKTAANIRHVQRITAIMLSVVAGLVLAVTALGIFGLAAFNVTTRTKQIGTRRAIGARRFHILRYFLVENALITTAGVTVGCVLALAVGVKLSLLYYMPRLPLYYLVGGTLLMWAIGLLAVWAPAKRASSVSPAIATRTV